MITPIKVVLLACGGAICFANQAIADPFVCQTPLRSKGAIVDTPDKCQLFFKFESEDNSDDVITRHIKLAPDEHVRSIGLIVAVGKFPLLSSYNIPAADNDADHLKDFLIGHQHFDEVIVLQDDDATISNIRYFIKDYLINRANMYSGKIRFLFAYSGHGVPIPAIGYKDDQQSSRDPSFGMPLPSISGLTDYKNLYGFNELIALLDDAAKNTYHMVVLINACYGGDILKESRPGGGTPSNPNDPGAYALTAGPDDKEVQSTGGGSDSGSVFFDTLVVFSSTL
jgi:hypothetical protein